MGRTRPRVSPTVMVRKRAGAPSPSTPPPKRVSLGDVYSSKYMRQPLYSVLSRGAGEDSVTIEVGPDHVKHKIPVALLKLYSDYFRNALSGRWTESAEGIKLEDVEPAVFNVFVNWLYSQELPSSDVDWVITAEAADASSEYDFDFLLCTGDMLRIKTYVFADRFLVPKLKIALNQQIVNRDFRLSIWYDVVTYAFDNLPPGNKILDFMVSWHCNRRWDREIVDERHRELSSPDKLPNQFLVKVMERYMYAGNYEPVPLGPRTSYVEKEVIALDDE